MCNTIAPQIELLKIELQQHIGHNILLATNSDTGTIVLHCADCNKDLLEFDALDDGTLDIDEQRLMRRSQG